ncbi:MAG: LPS assembly lipoprotein LptE [Roseibium sp.]
MSLFKPFLTANMARKGLALGCALLVGALVAGCQVRPLYGTASSTSGELGVDTSVKSELAAIDIESAGTDTSGRTLYNELTFNFERGAGAPVKKYRLKILKDLSTSSVAVEQFSDVPSSYTTTLNTSFVLSDINTEETLMTGRSFQSASFDFSNQRFANLRASRDAEERVAKAVADDITARIAGYFASRS